LVIASFVWRRKWKLSHTSSVLRAGFKLWETATSSTRLSWRRQIWLSSAGIRLWS
jgi:hypothetical protein